MSEVPEVWPVVVVVLCSSAVVAVGHRWGQIVRNSLILGHIPSKLQNLANSCR